MNSGRIEEGIHVPDSMDPGYLAWVDYVTERLKPALPYEPPIDTVVILGSGLNSFADDFPLEGRTVISEEEIGLPSGSHVEGHNDKIVAGITKTGKKILARSRNIHSYNGNPKGVETAWGVFTPQQAATGYIDVLDEIGARNIILSCAAGGLANPRFPGQPPLFPKIPEITVIGSDINFAYPSTLLGGYKGLGKEKRFPNLRESDRKLIDEFNSSLSNIHKMLAAEHIYCTSPSTSGYENRAQAHFAARNGYRLVGMSYSPEAEKLSQAKSMESMLGIGVVTNQILLLPRNNEAFLAIKKRLGIPLTEYDWGNIVANVPLVPSIQELQLMETSELFLAYPANHEDVKVAGKKATTILVPVVADMVQRI